MAIRIGEDVLPPRYTSVEPLARGGMGEIYTATDDALGRTVAVKVLSEGYARDEALRARFTREALAAARLSHEPHTVTIFDVGEWHDRPYIVMEHVAGGTIADRLDGRGHDVGEALRWLDDTAAALDAAHANGVVHRDVKPANLLLTRESDVRVADFGIASAAGLSSLTETGSILGTLGYLAPEQAMGDTVGPPADRYSLAVVAYELLAGRRPFQDVTGPAEALAARTRPIPPITEQRPSLPRELDAVFARALAQDPQARYGSCAEFVAELRKAFVDAAAPTQHWAPPTPPPTASHAIRRRRSGPNPLLWLLALALVGAAGVAAAVLLAGGDDGPRKAARPAAVKTITAQGSTVTVTAPAPTTTSAPARTAPGTTAAVSSGASGSALNDAGYSAMRRGDYRGALPLLESAVQKLSGAASLAEAYALYNLATTRFALGSCDGVLAMLDRSQQIQGHRNEIDALRRQAQARC